AADQKTARCRIRGRISHGTRFVLVLSFDFQAWGAQRPGQKGEEHEMRTKKGLYLTVAAIAIAAFLAGSPARLDAQQGAPVSIGATDLGGVVIGPNGPEAGVWVIAETSDLPTKMAKIVVTDNQGRYVLPDLPKANYDVWVRGYGLVDSPKVKTAPGK